MRYPRRESRNGLARRPPASRDDHRAPRDDRRAREMDTAAYSLGREVLPHRHTSGGRFPAVLRTLPVVANVKCWPSSCAAMKVTLLTIVSATVFSTFSAAAVTKLAPADRAHLVQAREVQLLRSMRQIPEAVIQACASVSASGDFRLADADQRLEATDVITDRNLPRKRFIWAARVAGYYVV